MKLQLHVLWIVLLCGVGCATPPTQKTPIESVLAPGTEGWSGDALALPKDSAWVITIDSQAVLQGAVNLKQWLVAEPLMFGESGPQLVQEIGSYWSVVVKYLGAELSAPKTWEKQGLDITRPIYIGGYAPSNDSIEMMERMDEIIASELGVEKSQLPKKLMEISASGEFPAGLHAKIVQNLEGLRSTSGMRLVIPASKPSDLLVFIDAIAMSSGYERFSTAEVKTLDLGAFGQAYFDPSASLPAFAARGEGTQVFIDVIFPAQLGQTVSAEDMEGQRPRHLQDLRWGVHGVESGRPKAPTDPGKASVSLGIDHQGAWNAARIREYSNALQDAKTVRADQRDRHFVLGVWGATLSAYGWGLRALEAPSVCYSLQVFPKGSKRTLTFDMLIFTARNTPDLAVEKGHRGLLIRKRALGFSLETKSLRNPAWDKWFRLNDNNSFDFVDAAESGLFSWISLPRNLLLILGELLRTPPETFDPPIDSIMRGLADVDRVETVALDADLRDFSRKPRLLAYLSFREDITDQQRQKVLQRAELALLHYRKEWVGTPAAMQELSERASETWLVTDSVEPIIRYRWDKTGALFSLGLTPEEAQVEWEKTKENASGTPELMVLRMNALSLLSLMDEEDVEDLKPWDIGVLGQRLGAMEATLGPERNNNAQYLRLRFTLLDPLSL